MKVKVKGPDFWESPTVQWVLASAKVVEPAWAEVQALWRVPHPSVLTRKWQLFGQRAEWASEVRFPVLVREPLVRVWEWEWEWEWALAPGSERGWLLLLLELKPRRLPERVVFFYRGNSTGPSQGWCPAHSR